MKFERTLPPRKYANYRKYRELTRADFRRFCAHCFRHEDEAGGEAHFEQDHFKPKRLPDVDPSEYTNLYWSCHECNAPRYKGQKWPNAEEQSRGEVFCDPCDHDPVGTDYVEQEDFTLQTLTAAGAYTNRHIRLSERRSLLECRQRRRRIQATYRYQLRLLNVALEHAKVRCNMNDESLSRLLLDSLEHLVAAYSNFVERDPFVIRDLPPEIPGEVVDDIDRALRRGFNASNG